MLPRHLGVRPLSPLAPMIALVLLPAIGGVEHGSSSPLRPAPARGLARSHSIRPPAIAPPRSHASLFEQLVEREVAPLSAMRGGVPRHLQRLRAPDVPRPPATLGGTSALDCRHATHDITLDPRSGATSATLELRVRAANAPLGAIGFSIDEGLTVGEVTISDRSGSVADAVFPPNRVVRVELSPPLQPNEEAVVTMAYSGTLSCGTADGGTSVCAKGGDFAYFAHHSIFPYIYDPDGPESFDLDALTRDVVLRVPASLDVIATGQRASESIVGDQKVSTWTVDKPLSRTVGMYAFAGKLGMKQVEGRPVPTTYVFPAPEKEIDRRMVSWSSPALDFLERVAGGRLPFERSLTLVRLPEELRDPGTATFGMTLLSDSYARAGDLVYEETWAHENAHLFWGIVVPETNAFESRLMSEGMATLVEIDYSYERHFASEDRDRYLARRFLPIGLDITAASVPNVVLAPGTPLTDDFRTKLYMLWAYYKPAATLDHLRATVGDDVFARALRRYVDRCSFVGCRPHVLRETIEAESGADLSSFFERWVTGSERPEVTIGFVPTADGAEVELTKPDERPMTLDLRVSLADGTTLRRRADLGPRVTRIHVEAPSPIVSVAPNPRHDALVDVRSAVVGDLDFDGETDGFDILRCAHLVGAAYEAKGATGLWNLDERFDPRCDADGDRSIDDDDLERLAKTFGKLRER